MFSRNIGKGPQPRHYRVNPGPQLARAPGPVPIAVRQSRSIFLQCYQSKIAVQTILLLLVSRANNCNPDCALLLQHLSRARLPSHPGSALWHFVCNGGTLPPDLKYGDESFWDTASAVQGGPRQNRDGLTCTSISTTSAYLKITRRTAHHIRSSGPGGASYGGCHF